MIAKAGYLLKKVASTDLLKSDILSPERYQRIEAKLQELEGLRSKETKAREQLHQKKEDLSRVSADLEKVRSQLSDAVSLRRVPTEPRSQKIKERLRRECEEMNVQIKLKLHEVIRLRSRISN